MVTDLHPDGAISLLIIDHALNDVEACVNAMRNAGIAVHPTRVQDPDVLVDLLEGQEFDMVFFGQGIPGVELAQAASLVEKLQPDVPLIFIAKAEYDPKLAGTVMKQGARDVVHIKEKERIHLVATREHGHLQLARLLKQTQAKLRESESRCNSLVLNSRDAIAYVHEGMYINANQAYLDMFGVVDMEDLEGMPILDMVASEDLKKFKEFLKTLGKVDTGTRELQVKCRSSEGKTFDAQLEFSPASIDGEPCTQIIIHDQTNSKELEQKLRELSSLDTLTGLANRQALMEHLEGILAQPQQSRKPYSVLYLLIDNLQDVRLKAGINAADALVKELAGLLGTQVGGADIVARFSENTFVIVSERAAQDEAKALGEKIRAAVDDHLYTSVDQMYQPTCSIGISFMSTKTENAQGLLNQGFSACEMARSGGGNQVAIYDATKALAGKGKGKGGEGQGDQFNALIQHALEHDRFKLLFQPVVSLQGDSRENYSVLLRLLDNEGKTIPPVEFLSYAVQENLMAQVDRWVIQHAIKELATQRAQKSKICFFVTISASGVQDESLLLWICDCLRDYKAKGAWFTFQFHEEDVRAHTQAARKLMEGLKKIGATISIDQFGKLPKWETLLKHLPVDFVKMDISFAKDLATNQEKQDQLNQIARQVTEFNAKTVAVGVEDANSLAVLWTIGVNYIQGHYLQEPSDQINYDFTSF